MAGSALDQGTLERLDQSAEIEMITPRRDGSASRRPIWVVVMDGYAYVRSYLGPRGAWYSRAAADGEAAIGVRDDTIEVGVERVNDEELNRQVSEAYRAKYGANSPDSTEAMITPEVTETTLRLTGRAPA